MRQCTSKIFRGGRITQDRPRQAPVLMAFHMTRRVVEPEDEPYHHGGDPSLEELQAWHSEWRLMFPGVHFKDAGARPGPISQPVSRRERNGLRRRECESLNERPSSGYCAVEDDCTEDELWGGAFSSY